jgi:uncharacterized protein YuzE
MSLGVFPKKFNNLFRSLEFFNPADFTDQVYVENLVSDNIQSTNVLSNNLQSIDAENGDSVSVATQNYVAAQVNSLIGGSSDLLDTLGEISDALQGDGNFAGHVWNKFGDVDASMATVNSHLTVLDASGVAINTRLNAHDSHFTQLDSSGNTFNTRLNGHDTSLSNLAAKTNAISFDSASNTTTLNSKLVVSLSETNQGNTIVGDQLSDILTVNAATTFLNTTPQAPTPSTSDNSLKLATTAYVKNQLYLTTGNAASTYSTITNLNALQTQLNNDETNYNTHFGLVDSSLNSLQQKTSVISYNAGTDTLNIASKINIAKDITEAASIYLGDNSGNDVVYLQSNISAAGQLITPAKMSYLSTLTGNVQTALDLKSADSTVVHNSGNEIVAGIKTFSSAPVLPNNSISNAMINNSCINSGFCDGTSSIQTQLNARALDSAVVHNSSNESISGQKTFSTGITLNGTDLNTRITSIESTNTSQSSSITGLQQKTSSLNYDAGTDTLSIASKVNISKDVSDIASIYLGDSSGNDIIYIKGNLNASSAVITPVQLSYLSTLTGNVKDSLDSKASITYVDTSVANLINSAPSALNTLNELATALGNDANYSTTITTALGTKAADSTVVHNTGTESISGQKTFSTGITLNGTDLNTRITSIETTNSSQTTSINNLNSKTSSLSYDGPTDTLSISSKINIAKDVSEIASIYLGDSSGNDVIYIQGNISSSGQSITPAQLGYISGLTSNAQTQITAKANDSAVVKLTTNQTIAGIKTFSSAPVLPSNSITNAMINNSCINSGYCDATSSIQTQIGTKANDNAVVKLTTDQTIAGIKTFSSAPVLPSNSVSNSMINNSCISSGYCDATSSIQTQIDTKANDSAVVKLTTDQTIAGIKTFSSAPVLPSNSVSNSMINNSCINSGYCDATSSIQTQLNAKATDSLACHLAGTESITGAKTFSGGITLSSNITANSCTITPTELSYIDGVSSNLQTQLDAKAGLSAPALTGNPTCTTQSSSDNSTRIASTAYVQSNLSSYGTLASSSTYSGNNTFSGTNSVNIINETVNSVSSITTALSLDYTTCKGINYIQTPTSNFSLALTNIPTGSTNAVYTITLMMAVKYYANSCTVNGTSRTMQFGGGSANVSVHASANYVLQQVNVMFLNSSTPIVSSNVLSLF